MNNKISSVILRAGLGVVFLIFGIGKLRGDEWADMMRSMEFFAHLPWSVNVSIVAVGISEVVLGLALILGFLTRICAFFASLELFFILALLYFQGIKEIRDIGLLAMAIALCFSTEDHFSLDHFLRISRRG